ncbi:MAG: hypothetical protein OHK0024_21130 [Thalassobaculales bacterium]
MIRRDATVAVRPAGSEVLVEVDVALAGYDIVAIRAFGAWRPGVVRAGARRPGAWRPGAVR